MFLNKFVVLSVFISVCSCSYPIVMWHGMGDSCCSEGSLGKIIELLKTQLPNVTVISLQFGDSTLADIKNGYFADVNDQITQACEIIAAEPEIQQQGGYNAIGFSQGGQFLRAVAQRCPTPAMKSLISLGGQHQGVYGLPRCGEPEPPYCDYIRKMLNYGAYIGWIQSSLIQAQYWHDPLDEDTYRKQSIFLADINNELTVNEEYVTNLKQLEHLVLVKFENDSMVAPRESSWFGFYEPGQSVQVTPLEETDLYKQDKIGLKALNEDGKLQLISTEGDHLRFTNEWFVKEIIEKYLKN